MRPIVALLTDFGSQDHYVGAVRGAVLAACREAAVVDLTQELPPPVSPAEWEGAVLHVDRFGNLITNFTQEDLEAALATVNGDPTELVVVVEGMVLPLVRTYSDVCEGEACAVAGSTGRLEVSINRGSAARQLGAARGAPVRVRRVSITGG